MSSKIETNPMPIIGYCDRFSVQPGETVRFMVSSEFPRYKAELVRLIHGSSDPRGPGPKEERVPSDLEGEYSGRPQKFSMGSCVKIPAADATSSLGDLTVQGWILPTLLKRGTRGARRQGIISVGGFDLFLDDSGRLCLSSSGGTDVARSVIAATPSERPMVPNYWYFIACTYDSGSRTAVVEFEPVGAWVDEEKDLVRSSGHRGDGLPPTSISNAVTYIGALRDPSIDSPIDHFNGKIDGLCVFSRALTADEVASLRRGAEPKSFRGDLVAAWDFSSSIDTDRVADCSANRLDGRTVNSPKRAVTGHNWSGREIDFKRAPQEYGAIHFHEDDLEDSGWDVAFEFLVPDGMRSGTYAAKLTPIDQPTSEAGDYIPFFVRPPKGTAMSKIAFLAPTLSYMAYANDHSIGDPELRETLGTSFEYPVHRFDRYLVNTNLLSLYDKHTDGSGVCYASRLRPILTMRPDYREAILASGKGSPHQFSADLCLLDWMEAQGFQFDVITDEDLHNEGKPLLVPYKVIVTGSHPEYWSEQMLVSMEEYLASGGRLMYLGGNGFYWVTSIDPRRPHLFEVRRWGGTESWTSAPGEYYHSSTGELGGLWRNRGKPPQAMLAVGFAAQGFDVNRPYKRTKESLDPSVAFVFEGIGENELIGDFDSIILQKGAGGYEVDRLDLKLGTPHRTVLLATASGFSDSYQHVREEVGMSNSDQGGSVNPLVKADMTYSEYPRGGAVFSVGSISWCGALFYNGYANNVSAITGNVLRHFAQS